jgi:hypothetical protein
MSVVVRISFFAVLTSMLLLCSNGSAARQSSPAQLTDTGKIEVVGWKEGIRPFSQLSGSARDLARILPEFDPDLMKSIGESIEFLRQQWMGNPDAADIPKAYFASLQLDADQLSRVLDSADQRTPADEKTREILQDVADDLQIKASHCKSSSSGWASLIRVDISTLKADGSVVKGLEVWYVPKGWAAAADRWTRCRNLSSPATTEKLPPGKYMLRVANGEARAFRIGGDGKDVQIVELLVP